MNFIKNTSFLEGQESIVAIGVFDGVHKGHQRLINELIDHCSGKIKPVAVTFSEHPSKTLKPENPTKLITTTSEKVSLIKQYGVQDVYLIDFTKEFSELSAEEFCDTIIKSFRPLGFVVGKDFSVGKNRKGDVAFLSNLGKKLGFWVHTIEDYLIDNQPVRSNRIRECLLNGNISTANILLGRMFNITGIVVHGNKRGRELGYPTANMNIDNNVITPEDGIYATVTEIQSTLYKSVTSIGVRPTFGLKQRLIETYIIDYTGDLYGKPLNIQFVEQIRKQIQFKSIELLVKQIEQDVVDSLRILSMHDKE
jgi:riboflavin kinase/FMN adenylyltransferase